MANWASVERLGDPRDPTWQRQNLVPINVGGQQWTVFRPAASDFQGFLQDLAATGYKLGSSGGFNYRTIRGSDRLSQHAFGNAIDINSASNPMLRGRLVTDLPGNVAQLAAQHNLEWGGLWKSRPDPMHFEWKGGPGAGADYGGAPATGETSPMFDIFRGRVPASGLFDPQQGFGSFAEPPMTPERFLTGMIAGQNPLRSMILGGIMRALG